MGFFKKLQDSARMAKYIKTYYDVLSEQERKFYSEEEFVTQLSDMWGQQTAYEILKYPQGQGWPFNCVDDNPFLAERLQWARSEGATDEDIVWWWNLPPIERILMKGKYNAYKRALLAELINKGFEPERVMEEVKIFYATCDEEVPPKPLELSAMKTNDREYLLSENRPLPVELYNRIFRFRFDTYYSKDANNMWVLQKDGIRFSSKNALIRHLIKAGQI